MKHGFTLIELLVVVAIIVALLAILSPSLGAAAYYAKSAQCVSNRHQWHVGVVAYASDNFTRMPNWRAGSQMQTPHDIEWFLPAALWRDYQVPPEFMLCEFQPGRDAFSDGIKSRLASNPGFTGNPKVYGYDLALELGETTYWVMRGAAGVVAGENLSLHIISDRFAAQQSGFATLTDVVVLAGSTLRSHHQLNGGVRDTVNLYADGAALLVPARDIEVRHVWWRAPYAY